MSDRFWLMNESKTPTATSEGEIGEMRFDSTNLYFCISENTWRKIPLQVI